MTMELGPEEEKQLLAYARGVIAARLSGKGLPAPPEARAFSDRAGAFVTLHESGSLRGCIGHIVAIAPLIETIREMALAAAFEDPRFMPLAPEELNRVDLEITVLSPLRRIGGPEEIELGRHGLYLVLGRRAGVFLPQVPVEQGWDLPTYLEELCHKAGLPEGSWRAPDAELSVFEGLVFGEKKG